MRRTSGRTLKYALWIVACAAQLSSRLSRPHQDPILCGPVRARWTSVDNAVRVQLYHWLALGKLLGKAERATGTVPCEMRTPLSVSPAVHLSRVCPVLRIAIPSAPSRVAASGGTLRFFYAMFRGICSAGTYISKK